MKKSVIIIVLLFGLLVSCSTCSMGNLIQTTDTSFYPEIWKLPERRTRSFEFEEYDSVGLLFPKTIDDKTVVRFNFRYLTLLPVDTEYQLELAISYSDTDFEEEVERLKNLCGKCPVIGDTDYFSLPVYATVWKYKGAYEYALIDYSSNTIYYLTIQSATKGELVIDEQLMPKGFFVRIDSPEYCLYEELYNAQTT